MPSRDRESAVPPIFASSLDCMSRPPRDPALERHLRGRNPGSRYVFSRIDREKQGVLPPDRYLASRMIHTQVGVNSAPGVDSVGDRPPISLAHAMNPPDDSPLTGATFTLDLSDSDTQASIEPHSFTDASLILDAELGARRFGGFDVRNFLQWESTNFVPSGVLNLNQDCLAAIISLLRAEHLAFGRAYWSRTGAPGSLSPVGWNPNLTNLWGTYLSAPSVSTPPTGPGPTGPGPT